MRKTLISLILASPLALCQNAVENKFVSPNIKGITIGAYHCTIWMHAQAYQPYNFEGVCYGAALPQMQFGYLTYDPETNSLTQDFRFKGGQISWIVKPLADGTFSLEFYGVGKDDVSPDPANFVPAGVSIKGAF